MDMCEKSDVTDCAQIRGLFEVGQIVCVMDDDESPGFFLVIL